MKKDLQNDSIIDIEIDSDDSQIISERYNSAFNTLSNSVNTSQEEIVSKYNYIKQCFESDNDAMSYEKIVEVQTEQFKQGMYRAVNTIAAVISTIDFEAIKKAHHQLV